MILNSKQFIEDQTQAFLELPAEKQEILIRTWLASIFALSKSESPDYSVALAKYLASKVEGDEGAPSPRELIDPSPIIDPYEQIRGIIITNPLGVYRRMLGIIASASPTSCLIFASASLEKADDITVDLVSGADKFPYVVVTSVNSHAGGVS